MSALERFLRYVAIDTGSDSGSDGYPSTAGQWDLLNLLAKQLREMGVPDVRQDPTYGCVYATLPGNCLQRTIPSVGFIAHVDTSEAMSGKDIRPRIIKDFDGEDICLNEEKGIYTRMEDFPEMRSLKGKTIVVTGGTTLLGSDDKSGVTEIMEMLAYFTEHPKEVHGNICVAFTADEETGRGVDHFDVSGFGAVYAYTVDGDRLGDISCECFNAAGVKVTAKGCSVHPGDAYHKMKNALFILMDLQGRLPGAECPECTKDREGFYHLTDARGDVESAVAHYIIRDHDTDRFEERKRVFMEACAATEEKFGKGCLEVKIEDQYLNMKPVIDRHPIVMQKAYAAMEKVGIEVKEQPIRGGTDGARLTFMGLPCPNLGTGGANFHGKHEYLCVEEMETTIELLKQIVREYAAE